MTVTAEQPANPFVEAASAYAKAGWSVVPLHSPVDGVCDCPKKADCTSPAKHPRTMKGLSAASTEIEQIEKWGRSWPQANIGLVVPDAYVVVDIDGEAGVEALKTAGVDMPTTSVFRTGKGFHYIYATDTPIRPTVGIFDHVDLRGPGSYIVAPPSVHANGNRYEVVRDLNSVVPAPAWIGEKRSSTRLVVIDGGEPTDLFIEKGTRDNDLTSLAGTFRNKGMNEKAIFEALQGIVDAGQVDNSDGEINDDVLGRIAKSVSRYAPGDVPSTFIYRSGGNFITEVDQGVYRVTWSDPVPIEMTFDYLTSSSSRGETSAEISVRVDNPTGKEFFTRSRKNLLADSTLASFAKNLGNQTKGLGIDWDRLVNDACQWVLTTYRRGDPVTLLQDAPDPATGDLSPLAPFLSATGATILFGDGGASKSYLALAVGMSLATGIEIIPGWTPARQMKVAYLDWEWDGYVHRRRMQALMAGHGVGEQPQIVYVPCRLTIREERDRLRHAIRDHEIEFMVIDSVALAAGGEPQSSEVAIGFFSTLRELGVPALLIAHVTNAASRGEADRPFGSAYWHNSARATWFARRDSEAEGGSMTVALLNKKTNDGPMSRPVGIVWTFGEGTTKVATTDDIGVITTVAGDSAGVKSRIVAALQEGPKTVTDIARAVYGDDYTKSQRETVRSYVNRFLGKTFTYPMNDAKDGGQVALIWPAEDGATLTRTPPVSRISGGYADE